MKKTMILASTFALLGIMSCTKDNSAVLNNTLSTKWMMGNAGKTDTTITTQASQTGILRFKINRYTLCPTHIIGLTIKVNGLAVIENEQNALNTEGVAINVKANDRVSVQTYLVPTFAKIACFTLGDAECELLE